MPERRSSSHCKAELRVASSRSTLCMRDSGGVKAHVCACAFQDYLATESIDDLVALLRKARLDTHLLDLFPPQKRTLADLDEHFKVAPHATHPAHPPASPEPLGWTRCACSALAWPLRGALMCDRMALLLSHDR